MSHIIECYTKFLDSIPSNNNDSVDMVPLFSQSDNWTPVQLEYNDVPKSIANLNAVAIRNFCQTYKQETIFEKFVLNHLSRIVVGDADEHIIAQRMLFLHYSKRRYDLGTLSYMLKLTCNMRVKDVVDANEAEWIKLANKVISHTEINAIIDDAIKHFGLSVCTVAEPYVKITLVTRSMPDLRGFVGINEIVIHADHFADKIKSFNGSLRLLQQIARMDIISVVIHELAHMKIRRITNDLNSHTPVLASQANVPQLPTSELEFGVFVEKKVFGKHVNWFGSAVIMQEKGKDYINHFIDAVEQQKSLPKECVIRQFVLRSDYLFAVPGMDIELTGGEVLNGVENRFKLLFSNLFLIQLATSGLGICGPVFALAFSSATNPVQYMAFMLHHSCTACDDLTIL